jgi:hypothetical protein
LAQTQRIIGAAGVLPVERAASPRHRAAVARVAIVVAALMLFMLPDALAQRRGGHDRPPPRSGQDSGKRPDRPRQPPERDGAHRERERGAETDRPQRPVDEASRPAMDRVIGHDAFRPRPEDFGPIRLSEEQEFESFVRARMPQMYQHWQQARQRDRAGFDRRMQEMVPRLRHLMRLMEEDPQLGQRMIRHTQNMMSMRMARQAWAARPADRPQIRRRIRAWIAENYRIELDTAETRLRELEQSSDARTDDFFALLQDPDANLEGEPATIRELAGELRQTQDEQRRTELRARLRELAAQRIDAEVDDRSRRTERMRRSRSDEIEKRYREAMQQLEDQPGKRPPGPRGRP